MKTKVWIVIWGLKDGGAEVLSIEFGTAVEGTAFQQAAQSYVWLRDKLKENGFM